MKRLPRNGLVLSLLVVTAIACAPSVPTPAPAKSEAAKPAAAPAGEAAKPAAAPAQPAAKPAAAGLEAARAKAQAGGLLFAASHDEIVEKAKLETAGVLKVQTTAEQHSNKALREGFLKLYPFAKVEMAEITGTDAYQRFLLEAKSGTAKEWDIVSVPSEFVPEWEPFLEAIDMLGMAEQGVLAIPPKMVSTANRRLVGMGTTVGIVAYNKNLVPPDRVPKQWEDLLKPEWRGRKMMVEIRANTMAALVPAQGEEWVRNFASKIAAQEPVWVRGQTGALVRIAAGEFPLHSLNYFEAVQGLILKGSDTLAIQVMEPVPIYPTLVQGIQKESKHPYTSLLFMEYYAGPDGQKIVDEVEPLKGSVYGSGTIVGKALAGKKISEVGWAEFQKQGAWERMVTEAYGLPKAEGAK